MLQNYFPCEAAVCLLVFTVYHHVDASGSLFASSRVLKVSVRDEATSRIILWALDRTLLYQTPTIN